MSLIDPFLHLCLLNIDVIFFARVLQRRVTCLVASGHMSCSVGSRVLQRRVTCLACVGSHALYTNEWEDTMSLPVFAHTIIGMNGPYMAGLDNIWQSITIYGNRKSYVAA